MYAGVAVRISLVAVLCLGPLSGIEVARAHHSPAAFDTRKTISVTGVVTKYEWFNPHVYVTIEQTTPEGKKVEWEVECQPPSIMVRMGWSRETLRIGDVLTITGSPGRESSSKGLLAGSIKRADKTLLDPANFAKQFAPSPNAPKFVAKGLAGVWFTEPNFRLVAESAFPSAGTMTDEGARIFKSFDEKAMSPALSCIASPPPLSMLVPDLKQLEVGDGYIRIRGEFEGALRTVHLGATHEGAVPSHQGHSIGRWEGNTLVVETTHFAYHASGNALGLPSGDKKRLVERFTISADGTSLAYRYEVSDPQYLKAPKTGELKWTYRPDMKFAPEPCDVENARRFTRH